MTPEKSEHFMIVDPETALLLQDDSRMVFAPLKEQQEELHYNGMLIVYLGYMKPFENDNHDIFDHLGKVDIFIDGTKIN